MRQILTSLCFLLASALLAQTPDGQTQNLPINLVADQGEYDAAKGVATYTGNVDITQGQMNLQGDKVVITLSDGEVSTIESWGELAYFHYVPQDQPPIDGKGQYMIYRIEGATIDIDGKAWVKQEDNETNADHLTYYLEQERVKGSRVNITLIPKQK